MRRANPQLNLPVRQAVPQVSRTLASWRVAAKVSR